MNEPVGATAKQTRGELRRSEVVQAARHLVGIREQPPGSNDGPAVHRIQTATKAYRAPWCVSTVQYQDLQVLETTYAEDTANAYFYAQWAHDHGDTIPHPETGAAVIYHEGAGHAGRVVKLLGAGWFLAVEGNYADSVALVRRSVHVDQCTFILRREYR